MPAPENFSQLKKSPVDYEKLDQQDWILGSPKSALSDEALASLIIKQPVKHITFQF